MTKGNGLGITMMPILASAYLDFGIDGETEARVMPIDNYILATTPIGAGMPGGIIPGGEAVSDTRFVVYYFRPTAEGRLVFGGGETYSRNAPSDNAGVRAPSSDAHLPAIRIGEGRLRVGWDSGDHTAPPAFHPEAAQRHLRRGGIFRTRLAMPWRRSPAKYSPMRSRGDPARLDIFASLAGSAFPGGKLLRKPALAAGMMCTRSGTGF